MKSENQQGGAWSSLQWKPLVVSDDEHHHSTSKRRKVVLKYNHYDDTDVADPNDLEDSNSDTNDMGMLAFGIEVVDANSYVIQKSDLGSGVITTVIPSSHNTTNTTSKVASTTDASSIENSAVAENSNKKPNKKKNKKKSKQQHALANQDNSLIDSQVVEETIFCETTTTSTHDDNNQLTTLTESSSSSNHDDNHDVRCNSERGESIVQANWNAACGYGILLHPILCQGLAKFNYLHPTPIQACTLPAAILGRRNIVGAAPTGSGKTLSYALPILQSILTNRHHRNEEDVTTTNHHPPSLLQALIICPTRELTQQVQREIQMVSLSKVKCIALVGGLSSYKQDRLLLDTKNPPEIIVATPGRLWELISLGTYENTLNRMPHTLHFVVIDEADRMLCQKSFPQLKSILNFIRTRSQQAQDYDDVNNDNKSNSEDEFSASSELDESDNDEDGSHDDDKIGENKKNSHLEFLPSLAGVRGETRCQLLSDDILTQLEEARKQNYSMNQHTTSNNNEENEEDTTESIKEDAMHTMPPPSSHSPLSPSSRSKRNHKSKLRQTFVYSATLMLPPTTSSTLGEQKNSNKKRKKNTAKDRNQSKPPSTIEGVIADILEIAGATGPTKIVDLTSANEVANVGSNVDAIAPSSTVSKGGEKNATQKKNSSSRLPPGLTLYEAKCTQKHKDTQCYAFLTTTKEGSGGPALVFCNSIAAVKRVSETLRVLGLPARPLHAQMAQKSRFESVESLRRPNSRAVVVATDVAARGLDIPTVSSVIHYDTARGVDTFIHRAGRTARGVDGHTAFGTSLSLVSPPEEMHHAKICEALVVSSTSGQRTKKFDTVDMDGRLIAEAHTRVSLAHKIYMYENAKSIASKEKSWFQKMSREADMDLDDNEDDIVHKEFSRQEQNHLEAKRAKIELQKLLARPMRKQNFGKFLSGPGLTDAIRAEVEVAPYVVRNSNHLKNDKNKFNKGKKRRL
jgi:ATP-dependent RNA helicase DDX24/MAK5